MGLWIVTAASKKNGTEVQIPVEADDGEQARQMVEKRGYMISTVIRTSVGEDQLHIQQEILKTLRNIKAWVRFGGGVLMVIVLMFFLGLFSAVVFVHRESIVKFIKPETPTQAPQSHDP